MAVKILDAQLKLTVVDEYAKPAVSINQIGHFIVHLTQGFNPSTFPDHQEQAITASAHVPLSGGPDGTTFGFVQIARSNFFGAFYAGRIPREGSIGVLVHVPPALPNPVMLDAFGSPAIPWFEGPRTSFVPPTINSSWGDHPAAKIPSKLKNSLKSNVDNFIFQYIDDREFWTIFTAQDPGGTLRFIAHFHWQVRYDVKFMWRNGKVEAREPSKSFVKIIQRNGKGRPTEGAIQALLTNPVGPRANERFKQALLLAFYGPRGANRSENPGYFGTVPPDFWG